MFLDFSIVGTMYYQKKAPAGRRTKCSRGSRGSAYSPIMTNRCFNGIGGIPVFAIVLTTSTC